MIDVGILSYGLGNVKAFLNAYQFLNIPCKIIENPMEMRNCRRLILPGVGAFDNAAQKLKEKGFWYELDKQVLIQKKPILGVCIGMHLMALKSEEGKELGLDWFKNIIVSKLKNSMRSRVPHIGWNKVEFMTDTQLFSQLNNKYFYFLHSYKFNTNNDKLCVGRTKYDETFCSAIIKENIFGVQFHPEKSHENGYKLLHNFAKV